MTHKYTFLTVKLHVCENLLQAQLLFSLNLTQTGEGPSFCAPRRLHNKQTPRNTVNEQSRSLLHCHPLFLFPSYMI